VRAKKPKKLPVVLTQAEVKIVFNSLSGSAWLMATLLSGSGLRLKDVGFTYNHIVVRDGKGGKGRVTMLPLNVKAPLERHLQHVKKLHDQDLAEGFGRVYQPYALERKYPNASQEWAWQYVFPAASRSLDPRTGIQRRHHVSRPVLQRAVKAARRRAKIAKAASCHTFRHSYATHLLEAGCDIQTVQELLGYRDLNTAMIYAHVLNRGAEALGGLRICGKLSCFGRLQVELGIFA
jgi:integron integrase